MLKDKTALTLLMLSFFACACSHEKAPECYDTIVEKQFDGSNYKFYFMNDLQNAIRCAKENNKKVLLIFSAKYSSNKNVELNSLADKKIQSVLNRNYSVVNLLVDDNTELKDTTKFGQFIGRVIKTEGEKNIDRQIALTQTNSQPYFVILDISNSVLKKTGFFGFDKAGKNKMLDFLSDTN